MIIRLDKYLTEMGCGSRSQVKKAISKGVVSVNDMIEKRSERKINSEEDQVIYHGNEIVYTQFEYYMLNKPSGVVSATEDRHDRTVLDLITDSTRKDLFPVGRLDKDAEGLLLITNDGQLAHNLLSPKKHVDKVYYAKILGIVDKDDVECFLNGLDIGDKKVTMPATLEILSLYEDEVGNKMSEILLTIKEGRFHQVKRMFEAVGKKVVYLKRMKFGNLELDKHLNPGEYRKLSDQEVKNLC